ncbi:hypothetical protein [Litchfieldella rifensis]|uniref:ATP-grasp domain-containing protein n=1 Tax=Litchfieldella rifensis TaxID=762643 RepID=A0ABV7LST5_9GAMM
MISKAVIVFSGFNQRAVISFLRTLEEVNVPYGIIAHSNHDSIYQTSYKEKILAVRDCKYLDFFDMMGKIKILQSRMQAEKYVIAPSTEALNRVLLDNQDALLEAGCEVPLVDVDTYKKISDKHPFGKICRSNGIAVPNEYEEIAQASYPFVAKPKTYFSRERHVYSPMLIFNAYDKAAFLSTCDEQDFYYQEFVDGESYYLLYYFKKSGGVIKFSQKNFVQQPGGKSIIAAESSDFHQSDESLKYEALFNFLGFYGLVMVEVKKHKQKPYMIEANPRFWGPSQLFVDAGINLFKYFIHDCELTKYEPDTLDTIKKVKYFWFGGLLESSGKGRLVFHEDDEGDFLNNLPEWLKYDVHNRKDTCEIFKKELGVASMSNHVKQ